MEARRLSVALTLLLMLGGSGLTFGIQGLATGSTASTGAAPASAASTGTGADAPELASTGPVPDQLGETDPSEPGLGPITSRLAPMLAAGPPVQPLSIPEVGLYEAALMHPHTTHRDLLRVETLQPLPPELDAALGRVVAAHAVVATFLEGPGATDSRAGLIAQVTLASALDQAMPVLDHYADAPVGHADPAPAEPRAQPPTPPSPAEALLDLYAALGFTPEVVEALEAPARGATAGLPDELQEPLAVLLQALADYNRAALETVGFLMDPPSELTVAVPLSHDLPTLTDQLGELDAMLEETPLADLQNATTAVYAAAESARQALDDSPAGELTHTTWSDPLGLVVVGSPGCDVFDAQPRRTTCDANATGSGDPSSNAGGNGPVVNRSAQSPPVGTPLTHTVETNTSAGAEVDAQGLGGTPTPGWHMLVLDTGGDDVYVNNAGGIDAGSVRVEVDLATGGAVEAVRTVFIRENEDDAGDLCLPSARFCMFLPPGFGVPANLAALGDPGVAADSDAPAVGLPLASLVLDMGGDDLFNGTGREVVQGAARGLGLGMLVSASGNDTYLADAWAQGASDAWGTGLLLDLAGDDVYHATGQAQAYAELPRPGAEVVGDDDGVGQAVCRQVWSFGVSQGRAWGFDYSEGDGFTIPHCMDSLGLYGMRHARALLADTDGADTYDLADPVAGHGTARMHDDLLRYYAWVRAVHPDLSPALFVDLGGPEELVTPAGPEGPVPPTSVRRGADGPNASAQAWIHRLVERDDGEALYKTAFNLIGDGLDARWVCRLEHSSTPDGAPISMLDERDGDCSLAPSDRGTVTIDGGGSSGGDTDAPFCRMEPAYPWNPLNACLPDPFGPEGYRPSSPEIAPDARLEERTFPIDILVSDIRCIVTDTGNRYIRVMGQAFTQRICLMFPTRDIVNGDCPGGPAITGNPQPGRDMEDDVEEECEDPPNDNQDGNQTAGTEDQQDTLLIGSPTEVRDPPALTLIFATQGREDTTYLGDILTPAQASSHLLVDLGGHDLYEAGDEENPEGHGALATVAIGANAGAAALLVDRGGATMRAGDRSVGFVQGAGSAVAVLALEGGLDIESGQQSQAFTNTSEGYETTSGTMALIHLGDGSAGPSRLVAGNLSQAVSLSGAALLVGSQADDMYTVDGRGMGLCNQEFSTATPLAAFIEPGGNDTYTLGSAVGLGDCHHAAVEPNDLWPSTGDENESTQMTGSVPLTYGQPEGVGFFLDVRGRDTYDVSPWPPRPPTVERSGWPGEDDAWVSGVRTQSGLEARRLQPMPGFGTGFQGEVDGQVSAKVSDAMVPTGVGVDNARNLHHALASLCAGSSWPGCQASTSAAVEGWTSGSANPRDLNGTITDVHEENEAAGGALREANGTLNETLTEAGLGYNDTRVNASRQEGGSASTSLEGIARAALGLPIVGQTREIGIDAGLPGPENGDGRAETTLDGDACRNMRPLEGEAALEAPEAGSLCLRPRPDGLVPTRWGQATGLGSPTAPIDLAACNCSVALTIAPVTGGEVDLSKVGIDLERRILPATGTLTTMPTGPGDWIDAWDRLGPPGPSGTSWSSTSDIARVGRGGELIVDTTALPSTLAQIHLEMELWDPVAEETGGLVPPATGNWTGTLVDPAPVSNASALEHDGTWWLVLETPGPLDADTRLSPLPDVQDPGWDPFSLRDRTDPALRVDLPDLLGPAAPFHGSRACTAALMADLDDGEEGGSCWTGQALVTAVPLDMTSPPAQILLQNADQARILSVTEAPPLEGTAQTRVVGASEETYPVDLSSDGTILARGLPGTEVVPEGRSWVADLLDLDAYEPDRWATVTVAPEGDEGWTAVDPEVTLYTGPLRALDPFLEKEPDPCGMRPILSPPDDSWDEDDDGFENDRYLWEGVDRWRPTVVCGELLDNTVRHDLDCVWTHRHDLNTLRYLVYGTTDPDPLQEVREPACLLEVAGDGVRMHLRFRDTLDPAFATMLGDVDDLPAEDHEFYHGDTWLVLLEAATLDPSGTLQPFQTGDGDDIQGPMGLHIDNRATAGNAIFDPVKATVPHTNVTLGVPEPHRPGLLRQASDPIVEVRIEARGPGGEGWSQVATVDDRAIGGQAQPLNLSEAVEGNQTRLQLRTVFVDESQNPHATSPTVFDYDAQPPSILDVQLVEEAAGRVLEVETDEGIELRCDIDCSLTPAFNPLDTPIRPALHTDQADLGFEQVRIPVSDLVLGVPYNLTLTLSDELGNTGTVHATVETPEPLAVDASPMADRTLNRTTTLAWRAGLDPAFSNGASQVVTTARLETSNATCPLVAGHPAVETGTLERPNHRTLGPVVIDCDLPEGSQALLRLAAHAPREGWMAWDTAPVVVDVEPPRVDLEAPEGWTNTSIEPRLQVEDALGVTLEVTLDGQPVNLTLDAATGAHLLTVSDPGVHDLEVRATDEAGNQKQVDAELRTDPHPPQLFAQWKGIWQDMGILELRVEDELSGPGLVRASAGQTAGPWLEVSEDQPMLVAVPLDDQAGSAVVEARDVAGNAVRTVVPVEAGATVAAAGADPILEVLGPSALKVSFSTVNTTQPVVLAETETDQILRRVLPEGQEHTTVLEPLPPGARVNVTVALAQGEDLVPVGRASTTLPSDEVSPEPLTGLEMNRTDDGVLLTWDPAVDDVAVSEVVVHRDGEELARVQGDRFWDTDPPDGSVEYAVAAVDLAGNMGPWSTDLLPASRAIRVAEVTVEPDQAPPGTPMTVSARIEAAGGAEPDLVVLETWDGSTVLHRVTPPGESMTYAASLPAPALTLGAEDPRFSLNVRSGDQVVEVPMDPPVVAVLQPTSQADDALVPGPVLATILVALLGAAGAVRRWTR